MDITNFNLICIIMFQFLVIQSTYSETLQEFRLVSGNQSERYTANIENIGVDSNLSKQHRTDLICSERGAWITYNRPEYENENKNLIQSRESYLSSCWFIKLIGPNSAKIKSIRHIGHKDLEKSGLSLYEQKFFTGSELYFDGMKLNLPIPAQRIRRIIRSFGYTGIESWTLYEQRNFAGRKLCLGDDRLHTVLIDTVTIGREIDFSVIDTVGSLHRGCSRIPESKTDLLILFTTMYRTESTLPFNTTLEMDGLELRLPYPQSFHSFSLFGNQSWTLFEGMEMNGRSYCIRPPISIPNEYQDTQEYFLPLHQAYSTRDERTNMNIFHQKMTVGSIRQGCEALKLGHYVISSGRELRINSNLYIGFLIILISFK